VADVEDGGTGTTVQVLLDDSLGVVYWQIVACVGGSVPAKSTSFPFCSMCSCLRQVSFALEKEKVLSNLSIQQLFITKSVTIISTGLIDNNRTK
jgi:hypothetical protein